MFLGLGDFETSYVENESEVAQLTCTSTSCDISLVQRPFRFALKSRS